jgi:hypothetical protein
LNTTIGSRPKLTQKAKMRRIRSPEGADVKDAQALMRHSRGSTTMDTYQQFTPESQRRAVDKLSGLAKTRVTQ